MPDAITEEVIVQCVAKELGTDLDNVKINGMEKTRGSKPGDGSTCEIWRIDVKATVNGVENNDLNYVAKILTEVEAKAKLMREAKIVDCEVWFYENLAPKLQTLRTAAGLMPLKLPKVFYTNIDNGSIVMENLKNKLSLVPKSPKGISRNCIEQLLVELAKYHATTYHFLQTVPGGIEKLLASKSFLQQKSTFEFFPSMKEMNKKYLVQIIDTASRIIARAGHEELSQALKQQESVAWEKQRRASTASDDCKFRTLIHGDFWYNNVMVKLDNEQNLIDFNFIDFQIVMLNSVAVDVQYFLAASANMDDKSKFMDMWLSLYHGTLQRSLVEFGYKKTLYPLADFMEDIRAANYHALMLGLMHCNLHIIGSGVENPFENPDIMKGKSMEEMSKLFMDLMDTFAEEAQKIPGLVDRVVAITEEASRNGDL